MSIWNDLRIPTLCGTLVLAATLVGCEEANHDLADPPYDQGPAVVDEPVTVDPVAADREPLVLDGDEGRTDVDIDIDRERPDLEDGVEQRPQGPDQREERRDRIRQTLDNVDIQIDGERTDVQIGDGEVDVDTR